MKILFTAPKLILVILMTLYSQYSFGFGHFDEYSAFLYCYKGQPGSKVLLGQLTSPYADNLIANYGPNSEKYVVDRYGSSNYPVIYISGESSINDSTLGLVVGYVDDKKNSKEYPNFKWNVDLLHPNAPLLFFEDVTDKDGKKTDARARAKAFCTALVDACKAQYSDNGSNEIYSVFGGAGSYTYIYDFFVYTAGSEDSFFNYSCTDQVFQNSQ